MGVPVFVSENFGHRKTLCTIVISRIFVENFLSHSARKLRGGKFLCFRNVLITKIFRIMGVSGFCLFSLSHSAGNFRGGILLCFKIILITNFFGVIGLSGFCLFFCLTVPKNFAGEPFCVSEVFS